MQQTYLGIMTNPVADLLTSKGVSFIPSGKDYLTKCFNPDHKDTNPSFRIHQVTGIAHCFSCGFKTNIFKFYGVITNNVNIRVAKLKEKLRVLQENTNGLEPLEGAKPYNTPFRGISSKTLREFGAFKVDSPDTLVDRIIFPITDIRNKVSVFVARHTMSNGNPRYVLHPPGATIPMFPSSFDKKFKSMYIVEGIFDFLNLYDKGLHNVVCTFGTGGMLNNTAEKLLPYKVRGVEKIFILYDGDEAGRTAAAKIKPLIEEAEFVVEIVKLEEGTDPGEFDQAYVDSLIGYTNEDSNN